MYALSHDPSRGIHTLRWESYTSFNMPQEIKYTNIGADEIRTSAHCDETDFSLESYATATLNRKPAAPSTAKSVDSVGLPLGESTR
jgi:hypothetical protein